MIFFSDFIKIKQTVPYHINNDPQPYFNLMNKESGDANAIDKFFRLIAICHSVVPGNF